MPSAVQPWPRRAFVLTAGLGTRLRPFTRDLPKPLVPLWGRPLLERTCEALASWGVREILFNLHHAPQPLRDFAAKGMPGLTFRCVEEPVILGTGGALRTAAPFFPADGSPIWILNGDIAFRCDPAPLVEAFCGGGPSVLASCWVTPEAGPRTVRLGSDGDILSFRDAAPAGDTFCGLQLVGRGAAEFAAPEGFDTLPALYERAMAAGRRILGVRVPGAWWADLGTHAQLVQAHRESAAFWAPAPDAAPVLPAAAAFDEDLFDFLAAHPAVGGDGFASRSVEFLSPRGSARSFHRLAATADRPSQILVRWEPTREDNALYGPVTRFLDALGVPVPRLDLDDPGRRVLVFEDVARPTLQDILADAAPERANALLDTAVDAIRGFHLAGRAALCGPAPLPPLMPPFDASVAAWERDYYLDACLRDRLALPPDRIAAARRALEALEPLVLGSPQTLIHRDLQSSNILFRQNGQAVFIDYQGLRPGPAAYDLASFLFDPYADLPAAVRARLLDRYCDGHPDGPAIRDALPAAAVQRLCQAMGAYATLSRKPGLGRFARYLPVAQRLLSQALDALPADFRSIDPGPVAGTTPKDCP